ncbi:MAG TPA: phosphate-starvation-inducible PsiE family protein [Candidatus Manganitrophaceae bacterium]|nr:phosphate-starvation-inducible PsiE family protein [Candidatus Manganitrophaceae bacterium]
MPIRSHLPAEAPGRVRAPQVESPLLQLMKRFNRGLHLMLGLALVIGSLMALALFAHDVYSAFALRTLVEGFFHALGSLLILWTFSELLNAEIRYLGGGRLEVAVFIEVAIAATIRHVLITTTEPFDLQSGFFTLGRLLILGAVYWLVSVSQRRQEETFTTGSGASPAERGEIK